MSNFLPYGRQTIDDDDIAAVTRVLRGELLTCGHEIEAFETEFAAFVGARYAVAVCNATAALHLAMMVAEVTAGDRVITSPITFLASANCAAYVGATPDFADIDPLSYNLDPTALEAAWDERVKAVVAVAYAGQSADMPRIAEIARTRGAVVIEDASHGTGGGFFQSEKAWKIGGHPWADLTVFSFHPVKTMTTGEGGMLVTNNEDFARQARKLRAHGVERDAPQFTSPDENDPLAEKGPWFHEMQALGYNFRITDIQCALGRSQLLKLPEIIRRRREIVAQYNEALAGLSWLTTPGLRRAGDRDLISWHLYTVLIDFDAINLSRSEVMRALKGAGVGSQVLYIPVYLQPWYRETYGYGPGKCPQAEAFYRSCLSLPLYPSLTRTDVDRVIAAVRSLPRK